MNKRKKTNYSEVLMTPHPSAMIKKPGAARPEPTHKKVFRGAHTNRGKEIPGRITKKKIIEKKTSRANAGYTRAEWKEIKNENTTKELKGLEELDDLAKRLEQHFGAPMTIRQDLHNRMKKLKKV